MKKILVSTDLSSNAMKAVMYACEIAKRSKAEVTALLVVFPGTPTGEPLRELDVLLSVMKKNYPDIIAETKLIEGDPIGMTITQYAAVNGYDLLVIGTRGQTTTGDSYLGSVSTRVVRYSEIPVLVVPYAYMIEKPDAILLATNKFEEDKELLRPVAELAKLFSATIHISIFLKKEKADAETYLENSKRLESYLEFLKESFPGLSVKAKLLDGESLGDALGEYGEENEIDMLVMISYPKNFWERLRGKSASRRIALEAQMPVMVLPMEKVEE